MAKKELKIASSSEAPFMVKKGVKVWNNQILTFLQVFSKETREKLIKLESESNIFMQKMKNLYWPLSMGLNQ